MRLDRSDDPVSIAQFVQGTGLPEERVRECLAFLCDTAQIFLRQDRPRRPHGYRLNPEMSLGQVDILEQRQRGGTPAGAEGSEPETAEPAEPPDPPAEPPRRPGAAARGHVAEDFAEHPTVDIVLGSDDQPVARRLRQTLPAQERAAFDHLMRHYPRAKREGEDSEVWGLFRLWQTYGFACLNNSLQGAQSGTDLSELNRACLLTEIGKLYEQEMGRLTPGLQEELARLAADYPSLVDWHEAFRLAIKLNKRRLSTVETILQEPAHQGHGRGPAAGASSGRRRTAARQEGAGSGRRRDRFGGLRCTGAIGELVLLAGSHSAERLLRRLRDRHRLGAKDQGEAAGGGRQSQTPASSSSSPRTRAGCWRPSRSA